MTQFLFNTDGTRKYLTHEERRAFLKAAGKADREVRKFCSLLAYKGCRVSEALALTVDRVDIANNMIVFESLKKRKKGVFRAVPVPSSFIDTLDMVHGLRELKKKAGGGKAVPLVGVESHDRMAQRWLRNAHITTTAI